MSEKPAPAFMLLSMSAIIVYLSKYVKLYFGFDIALMTAIIGIALGGIALGEFMLISVGWYD